MRVNSMPPEGADSPAIQAVSNGNASSLPPAESWSHPKGAETHFRSLRDKQADQGWVATVIDNLPSVIHRRALGGGLAQSPIRRALYASSHERMLQLLLTDISRMILDRTRVAFF